MKSVDRVVTAGSISTIQDNSPDKLMSPEDPPFKPNDYL
jgi:hypothetical protein